MRLIVGSLTEVCGEGSGLSAKVIRIAISPTARARKRFE